MNGNQYVVRLSGVFFLIQHYRASNMVRNYGRKVQTLAQMLQLQ